MSKKITIAEILHLAADKYLSVSWDEPEEPGMLRVYYSCHAIIAAASKVTGRRIAALSPMVKRINSGLRELGLNPDSCRQFDEFHTGEERQQARYNWLKFAALIAEEQGV